ncbi:MAG: hypothetical protein OZ924_12630 [Burkholderiaceae bacterium]|nr:hypothetical protein [Burkholderiaceae bacterium]
MYRQLLGLMPPWTVERVELDMARQHVEVYVGHAAGQRFACSECGLEPGVYDHLASRGWRHAILITTVSPAPSTAKRSGVYPGVAHEVGERPRDFIRPADDYRGLRFVFFLLDGEVGLDLEMKKTANAMRSAFRGAGCAVLVWQQASSSDNRA